MHSEPRCAPYTRSHQHTSRILGKVHELMGFKSKFTFKGGMEKIITFNTQEEYERMKAKYPDAKREMVKDDSKFLRMFYGEPEE